MKRGLFHSFPACLAAALCSLSTQIKAQTYSIDWFTIDGGGGTSTGGVYSVSGTIAQPDSGRFSGGTFTLEGGFWGIVAALQSPGAPRLRVELAQTNSVIIAWPTASLSFGLQQNSAINTTNWVGVTNAPVIVGAENQVTLPIPLGNAFYRLKLLE